MTVLAVLGAGQARASTPRDVTGVVESANAHWTESGRIVTESVIRDDAGQRVRVRQLGGTVDGIGMRLIPSPTLLRAGDSVRARIQAAAAPGPARVLDVELRAASPDSARPITALPYVRTTNTSGAQLYWSSGCVYLTYDSAGTSTVPGDAEFQAMDRALDSWRTALGTCSYMQIIADPPADVEVGYDHKNVVVFRDDRWCRPAVGKDPEECYDGAAAGLTTLYFVDDASSKRNGEILDADVELNAVDFAMSVDGVTTAQGCQSEVQNTFTHEMGHLLGLDHTCWTGAGTQPTDDTGNPVPQCGINLPSSITDATMYNFQECGETKKESLEADDIAGACNIYPAANDPGECSRVDAPGGCCSTCGCSPNPAALALLAGALLFLIVRRR